MIFCTESRLWMTSCSTDAKHLSVALEPNLATRYSLKACNGHLLPDPASKPGAVFCTAAFVRCTKVSPRLLASVLYRYNEKRAKPERYM